MLAEAMPTPAREAATVAGSPHHLTDALSTLDLPGDGSPAELLHLHEQFVRYGYVRLPGFLSGMALEFFRKEMADLEKKSMRRGFDMPGYETPRRLSVLGGGAIRRESPEIYALYHHHAIRGCVERIVGRRIYSCRHPEEFMVANFLQTTGDTHGWHLDDPPLALVIFAEAPGEGGGGEAEMVANWRDLCHRHERSPEKGNADLVSWCADNGLVERRTHGIGDAYLLRADLNLHRVAPLKLEGQKRWVVNLAFQVEPEGTYGDTASLLYGAEAPSRALS